MKIKKASKGKTTVLKVLSAILALLIVFAGVTTVITLKGVNENLEKALKSQRRMHEKFSVLLAE